MKHAWQVIRQYDRREDSHTVVRTKAEAERESRKLAEFYKARGRTVRKLYKWEGDQYFVAGDESSRFTIHIARIEVSDDLWAIL